jgi:hypothetical protein
MRSAWLSARPPQAVRQTTHGCRHEPAVHRGRERRPAGRAAGHGHRDIALGKIPPASDRQTDTTWRQFLRTQVSTMLACDFYHVDCALTLRRIYVLFLLEVDSRDVHTLGTATNPDGVRPTQQVRDPVVDLGERVGEFRFLVRDRLELLAEEFPPHSEQASDGVGERSVLVRCGSPHPSRMVGTPSTT